jgi:hypothetical protein
MPLCCIFSPERPPDESGSPQQLPKQGRSPGVPTAATRGAGVGVTSARRNLGLPKRKSILIFQVGSSSDSKIWSDRRS